MKKHYIFLGENLKVEADNLNIFDNYFLEKPDVDEISFLEQFIEKNIGILTSNNPFVKGYKESKVYNIW